LQKTNADFELVVRT
jgi:hypothetical protein